MVFALKYINLKSTCTKECISNRECHFFIFILPHNLQCKYLVYIYGSNIMHTAYSTCISTDMSSNTDILPLPVTSHTDNSDKVHFNALMSRTMLSTN